MKILYLPGYRYPANLSEPLTSGDLRYSFNLTRALAKLGHHVRVISRWREGDNFHGTFDGIEIFRYKSEFGKLFSTSFDISLNRKELFKKFLIDSDVLICNSPLSLELNIKTSIPIVYICSGLEDTKNYSFTLKEIYGYLGIKLLRDPCKRNTWRKAAFVNTTAVKEDVTLLKMGVPEEKITEMGPSIDSQRYHPQRDAKDDLRQVHGISPSTRIILSVARFTPAKGLIETVEAFNILLEDIEDTKLILIGVAHSHRHNYLNELKKKIEELNLPEKVLLLEDVPESKLPDYYSLADVFSAFSKDYDPLPTTIIESMACGTPVISTYYATRTQMIEDGESGLFIDEKDLTGWAQKVLLLLTDSALRKHIIRGGSERIERQFNSAEIAEQYVKLIKKI